MSAFRAAGLHPTLAWIRKHRHLLAPLVLMIATAAAYIGRFDRNWHPNDDCYYLDVTLRMMQGDVPYRDIAMMHPPGFFLFLWPFLSAFGVNAFSGKIALVLLGFATVLTAYKLARTCLPTWLSLIGGLCMIALGPLAFYTLSSSWLAGILLAWAMYFAIRWAQKNFAAREIFLTGLLLGLAFSVKQPFGLYPGMAVVLWMMLRLADAKADDITGKGRGFSLALGGLVCAGIVALMIFNMRLIFSMENLFIFFALPILASGMVFYRIFHGKNFRGNLFPKMLGLLTAGGICGLLPIVVYQAFAGGLLDVWMMFRAITVGAGGHMLKFYYPVTRNLSENALFTTLLLGCGIVASIRSARLGVWVLLGAILYAGFQLWLSSYQLFADWYWMEILGLWLCLFFAVLLEKNRDVSPTAQVFSLSVLVSGFVFLSVYPYPDPVYLIYPVLPFLLAFGTGWRLLGQKIAASGSVKVFHAASLIGLMITGWLFYRVFLAAPGLLSTEWGTTYLDNPRGKIYVDSQTVNDIMPAVNFLKNPDNSARRVLVLPEGPQIYFLSGLKNPTPYYDFPQPMTPEIENAFLQLVADPKTDYVLIARNHLNYRNLQFPHSLDSYLHAHYELHGHYGAYIVLRPRGRH